MREKRIREKERQEKRTVDYTVMVLQPALGSTARIHYKDRHKITRNGLSNKDVQDKIARAVSAQGTDVFTRFNNYNVKLSTENKSALPKPSRSELESCSSKNRTSTKKRSILCQSLLPKKSWYHDQQYPRMS